MDIIEINSSESDDDVEIGDSDSEDFSFSDGDIDNRTSTSDRLIGQNDDLGVELQWDPSSNNEKISQQNLHLEEMPPSISSSQQYQKRTLPSSFQQTAFKPASNLGIGSHGELVILPQQNDLARMNLDNGSALELNNIPHDRWELDAELSQHTQKRTLPSSLQPTLQITASGGSGHYRGGSQIHFWPQKAHDNVRANVSGSKVYKEDHIGKKNDEFPYENIGEHRILPSSVINSKSVHNSQVKASLETRGDSQTLDFQLKSHRFLPSIENGKLTTRTAPKTSTESRDEKGGAYRILPPSLIHGKFINGPHPTVASDGNRSGLGGDRHIEHDERVIYREALQNLSQPKVEDDLPEGLLSVPLLKHQKIALAWMVQKEKSVHCAGGILADDQGLGKTISTIALVQKQMSMQSKFTSNDSHHMNSEALNLDEDDDGVMEVNKTPKFEKDDLKIEKDDHKRKPMASSSMHTSHNWRPAAGTLVVCPASILRQWARELDEKVPDTAKLSVLIYHGGTRTKHPGDLAKYDVVLTTYAIVTNEVPKQNLVDDDDEQRNLDQYGLSSEFSTNKKRKQTSNARGKAKKKRKGVNDSHFDYDSGPLARVRWFRVVLDEAQTIKNHRTQVARACCGLRAKRRWCLSGTPIQNSIDDLYSYFRFLKYDPYSVYSSFCCSIKNAIARDASVGYKKLQVVLRNVLLRRTKDTLINGEPVVKLPPKSVSLNKIDFSSEERAFYMKLQANSQQQFKEYAAAGTVKQNYASILLMLLRLRQACDHPLLVKEHRSNTVGRHSLDMARQLPRDMLMNLLHQLDSLSICLLCSDPPEDAVATICGHVFCYQCVSDRLSGEDNQCPAAGCKEILGSDVVFTRATLGSCLSDNHNSNTMASSSAHDDESSIVQSSYVSSKIRAAVEILNSFRDQSSKVDSQACDEMDFCSNRASNLTPEGSHSESGEAHISAHLRSNPETPVKAIVFSQWTSMLDLLETSLNHSLIQYRRLDGTMSLNSRDMAVREFNNDPEVTVMIMSLKAGNLGLNMTAASHVILLDLWWNPAAEDQAVDRAHRIGQTRTVTVSRLAVNDTVEDRILELQEEKRKMVSSAFGEDQNGSHATRLTMEDLRFLFEIN